MHGGDLNGKEIQKGWNTCIPIADLLCSTVKTQYFKATILQLYFDFPGGSDGKASVYNAGDPGSSPGLGRSPGEGMATHSSTIAWKIPWTGSLLD